MIGTAADLVRGSLHEVKQAAVLLQGANRVGWGATGNDTCASSAS